MTAHEKTILKAAEKLIEENASKLHSFGLEIENLPLWVLNTKSKAAYLKEYRKAKKNNPEIWTCNAFNLPDNAYYENRYFFEWLFRLSEVDTLLNLYPAEKNTIKRLFNNSKWSKAYHQTELTAVYDYVLRRMNVLDELPDFSKVLKAVNSKYEKIANNFREI